MIALRIEDRREFTRQLFMGTTFDHWLTRQVSIVTYNVFTIDGRARRDYYSREELEEGRLPEFSPWSRLRPFCYSLIKGKRLPESFQITLQLDREKEEAFAAQVQSGLSQDQVNGFYLNIRYEEGELRCVSGLSLKVFTLDKQLEYAWDEALCQYFRECSIPFTVV